MADISVTAANVQIVSGLSVAHVTAGIDITAGEPVYEASGKYWPAQADDADTSDATAIALNSAGADQPLAITQRRLNEDGVIDIGGTVAVGTVYVVSAAAAGGIAPWADLAATNRVTVIGVGVTTARIKLSFNAAGVAIPT